MHYFRLDVLSAVMLRRVARVLNGNVAFDLGLELGLPVESIELARRRKRDHINDYVDAVFYVLLVRRRLSLYERFAVKQ